MTTVTKTTTTTTTEFVAVLDNSVEELIVEFNEAKAAIKIQAMARGFRDRKKLMPRLY
jgi:hypothetical protein